MSRTVWVIDSVALFDIKREVTANDQWDLMKRLETLVEAGTVVISEQVAREARAARHVDLPEAWVLGVYRRGPHRVTTNPSNPNYLRVMRTVGPQIVDPAAESDPADPWVLALALDMQDGGHDGVVVTHDQALVVACLQMGVAAISLHEFLGEVRRLEADDGRR